MPAIINILIAGYFIGAAITGGWFIYLLTRSTTHLLKGPLAAVFAIVSLFTIITFWPITAPAIAWDLHIKPHIFNHRSK